MEDLTFAFRELFIMAGYWLLNLLIYVGIATLLWAPFVMVIVRRKKDASDRYHTFLYASLLVLMALAVISSLMSFGKIGIIPYPTF